MYSIVCSASTLKKEWLNHGPPWIKDICICLNQCVVFDLQHPQRLYFCLETLVGVSWGRVWVCGGSRVCVSVRGGVCVRGRCVGVCCELNYNVWKKYISLQTPTPLLPTHTSASHSHTSPHTHTLCFPLHTLTPPPHTHTNTNTKLPCWIAHFKRRSTCLCQKTVVDLWIV